MKKSHPRTDRRKLSPLRIASYAGIAVGAIMLVCVLVLLFFPGPLVNRFVKPRISKALAETYPAYAIHFAEMDYSVFKNRFGFDSVALRAVDGTFSSTLGSFSVSGIAWMHLLWGGNLTPHDFANVAVDAQDIVLHLPKERYELRCRLLHVSSPDSEVVIDSLRFHPSVDDEHFFAESKFRQTRFRAVVPHAKVTGLACLDLLQGTMYRAHAAQIHDVFLDVLINKDRDFAKDSVRPPMPSEILSSIKGILQVGSVNIVNGQLKYGERFAVGGKPALITLDSMNVLAQGIANHGNRGAALDIHAQGMFMKAGTMKLHMSIPVPSPEFSYQYSGSVDSMDLSAINSFLEIAEHMRIKSGMLQAATFDIKVDSGRASGTVRAIYRDLALAAINKESGSEKGLSDGIASFIANTFTLRGTNVPDTSGSLKNGEVKYLRKGDEYFFEYSWFALRSGVGNLVGF